MVSSGVVNVDRELQKRCLWFYSIVLQMMTFRNLEYWNSYHIRPSRYECISGSPDILFYLPERSGGVDNLQEVTHAKIFEIKQRHIMNDEENGYKDYLCHYVIENESLQYPTNAEQAFNTFQKLMSISLPS